MRGWSLLIIFILTGQLRPVYGQQVVSPVFYSVPGSVYAQNFDGLPSSGTFSLSGKGPFNLSAAPVSATNMGGWQIFLFSGSNANAGFGVATGSSTGNAVYSLGAGGSGERALGSLSSGAGIYAMGAVLTNQTGGPLNQVTVGFTAEQWRKGGSGNRNTWTCRYKTGTITSIDQSNLTDEPNLNFGSVIATTSVATLVGNQPENQQAVSYTITGLNWKAGEQLLLRWDDADETGNDDIVAIDNFNFSAELVSTAPVITSVASANITTNTAEISAVVNDNYAGTIVRIEYDTSAVFSNPSILRPPLDTLPPGSGNTNINAQLPALLPGRFYYFRIRAQNSLGTAITAAKNFTTLFEAPVVTALSATSVSTCTAVVTAGASGEGISEKGIVWAITNNPSILNNKIIAGTGSGNFSRLVTGLPQGSVVFIRAYAINAGGIAYGDTIRIVTQTVVSSILPATVIKTNAATVQFVVKTAQALTGLSPSNFELQTNGITGASVTSVASNANGFIITVNTGNGNGTLSLTLVNDAGLSLPVNNKPFSAPGHYLTDKLAPQLRKLDIPPASMKIGDTVAVTISLLPDPEVLKLNGGNINGFSLAPWVKKNDSIYTSSFVVASGGNDVEASKNIPFLLSMSDSIGNTNQIVSSVIQPDDPLDANRPYILSVQNPPKGIYKTGDTLDFIFTFNEKVNVSNTGVPSITVTIGTRGRTALFAGGNSSDRLLLRYIIVPDDLDIDGIKTTSSITLNGASIKDIAGNNALLGFTGNAPSNGILVDAVAPVINAVQLPANKTYRAGDTLQFVFGFSKGIILTSKEDTPVVKLTIGTLEKDLLFRKQSETNNLLFTYITEYGDIDKNGISLSSSITTKKSITDSLGNPANLNFKTTSLANIRIDGVAPVFSTAAPENVFVCENGSLTITNVFAINDDEAGELVSWRIRNTPVMGTVSLAAFSLTSTGKNIIPAGIVYRPYPDKNGTDTLITELTDGINTSQKTILISIQPALRNNIISTNQLICEEKPPALLTGSPVFGGAGSFKYVWDSSVDAVRFYPVQVGGDQAFYQPPSLRGNTWFRRRVMSGACADTSVPVSISLAKNGYWTGGKSSDWNNPANWCGSFIPGAATNVMVFADAPYQPQVKDTASCNDILLGDGARLSITGSLSLSGNITASPGSVQANKGTITCSGNFQQNINGDHFEKNSIQTLIIDNAAGVSLSHEPELSGALVLTKGFLQTNDHLLLKEGAMIGASASGTAVIGKVSITYLIKGGRKSFQLFGHPFNHSIGLKMIGDSIDITGENGSLQGFTTTASNEPSAFRYDFTRGNDSTGIDAGWLPFTNTNGIGNNAWQPYTGIRLLFSGAPGQGSDGKPPGDGSNGTYYPNSVLLKLTGEINNGEQGVVLPGSAYANYHVIANPFAANIEMSRITKSPGIANHYWLWNPQQGKRGGYTSFPFSSANALSVLGAFVVKTSGSNNNSLLFTEQCKTTAAAGTVLPFASDDLFFIELRLESDSIFWDRILLLQLDSARAGVDRNDAEKFINDDVNLYFLSREHKKLSIDARPVTNETIIPIGLQANGNNRFSLRIANVKVPASSTLMLHDKYLDKWMPLEKDSIYQFNTIDDTLSKGDKRFELATRPPDTDRFLANKNLVMKTYPVPAKHTIVVKYASTETANTTIRIVDLSGHLIKTVPLGMQKQGQVIVPVANLQSGIYIVEINCGNDVSRQKIIIAH